MTLSSRPYHDKADYDGLRTLLMTTYAVGGPPVYCTVGDLDWWCWIDDDPAAIHQAELWVTPDQMVIGFAWPASNQVDLITHPDYRALESEMLQWAEARHKRSRTQENTPAVLRAWCYRGDAHRETLFRARGYQQTNDFFSFFRYDLDRFHHTPVLPPGYSIRHVGDDDIEARVAVHRDAFNPSRMTIEKYSRGRQAPTYRPELDLVVVAPDEQFAAFCIVWFDEVNRIGLFEPVGCHSAHRRLGLASAVIHEGMRRIKDYGAKTAFVNGSGSESAGSQLYTHLGFTNVDRNYAWEKEL